ncbi:hypothetical protein L227DRAFT_9889 [Lentinus tigrinus ALCF2SS1-6]|uniref:Uncharacterized protein n=1 Tax=Lentinus tigrinus ALCF2SS1-6 TaxID=1328759 RepID=A0A5C2SSU3_9APHY|nr:hypothetical protein L227DRAFT_9889 [Lentinus tigrinus ALCF2SS1-6]
MSTWILMHCGRRQPSSWGHWGQVLGRGPVSFRAHQVRILAAAVLWHARRSLSHTRNNTSKRSRGMETVRVVEEPCSTPREDNSGRWSTINCDDPDNGEQAYVLRGESN